MSREILGYHTFHLIRSLLGRRTYFLLAIIVGLIYSIAFAFGTGMFLFYSSSVAPLMENAGLSIPYLAVGFRGLPSWTNPSLIWFPSGNFEAVLYFGPTISVIGLSTLMALNTMLMTYRFKNRLRLSGTASFGGVLSVIPLLATSGCGCTVPLLTIIAGTAIPTAALVTFQFQYGWLVNLLAGTFMLGTLTFSARLTEGTISSACKICNSQQHSLSHGRKDGQRGEGRNDGQVHAVHTENQRTGKERRLN